MNSKCDKITIYSFFIFFLFLISMELWIGWGARKSLMLSLFGVGALSYKLVAHVRWTYSHRNFILCSVFYLGYFLFHKGFGLREFCTQILPQLIPIICIVFLEDKYKKTVLDYITRWFAVLMVISIILYIFTTFVDFPDFGTLSNGNRYGTFKNYIFYVKENGITVNRFGGPFLEPGYLGMMGAFLLFVNEFDFNKIEIKIIVIAILLTLSLAGWALAFIGFVEIQYYKGNLRLSKILSFGFFAILFILVSINYNNGDNILNNEIFSRLAYDSEKGFVGNNRNVVTMMIYFQEMWSNYHLLLYGYPESAFAGLADWETIGAGLDRFVVFHGLIGVLYVFLFYIASIFYAKNKKYALLFLIFVLICFWQRTYALWFSWIICFHYSIVSHDRELKSNKYIYAKKRTKKKFKLSRLSFG